MGFNQGCCDNGLNDIACGIGSIVNGFGKGICCGLNTLGNLGCSMAEPAGCCCECRCRPCRCRPRPCNCSGQQGAGCRCKCDCCCD